MDDFKTKVIEITKNIPTGRVSTYGLIAEKAGLKSSARQVGYILNSLKSDNEVPCHRVVNRLGILSGKNHFQSENHMKELLESEGVEVLDDTVDLNKYLWKP